MAATVASMTEREALRPKVHAQLRTMHATKSAALRMFAVMLPAVRRRRDARTLPEIQDLLERMADAFGGHEERTRAHLRELDVRLSELGIGVSRALELGMGAAAVIRGNRGRLRGHNFGADARDAFLFEHLEIAGWETLGELATRAGDERTAELARRCCADDDEMAALIRRNFPNVLTLVLACQGLPTLRPPEGPGDADRNAPAAGATTPAPAA